MVSKLGIKDNAIFMASIRIDTLGNHNPTTRKKIHFRRWGIGKSTYNNVHIIVIEQLILFKIIT